MHVMKAYEYITLFCVTLLSTVLSGGPYLKNARARCKYNNGIETGNRFGQYICAYNSKGMRISYSQQYNIIIFATSNSTRDSGFPIVASAAWVAALQG